MTWTARLLPILLAGTAALVLAGGNASPSFGPGPAMPETPPAPPLESAASVEAAPRPAVLVGRAQKVAEPAPPSEALPPTKAVVTVLGPDGPCKGLWMDVFGLSPDRHRWERTDAQGRVRLENTPYDGTVTVIVDGLPAEPEDDALLSRASASIRGPETVIRIAATMPLTVTFRDVETGERLPGLPFRLHWEEALRRAATRSVTTRPGYYVSARAWAQVRPPLVAFDGLDFKIDVSRRATALRMEATLRHEALAYVRAVDLEGRPVPDADATGVEVAGRTVRGRPGTVRDGDRIRVHGVPYLRGERVRVLVERLAPEEEIEVEVEEDSSDAHLDRDELLPDDMWRGWNHVAPGFGAIVKGRLPPRIEDPLVLTAVFDPMSRIRFGGMSRFLGGGHGDYAGIRAPKGHVEVRVEDAEGRPIRGARTEIRGRWVRTDLDGRAFFPDVPEGERIVLLREPGWVKTRHPVIVRGGETIRTTLVEDDGGELLVRVLGDDGLPLTGARLEVPEWIAWADVEDGVQRLDLATDHRGERLLRRFPAGKARIDARWGRRRGDGAVRVESGRRQVLEIRLAPDH